MFGLIYFQPRREQFEALQRISMWRLSTYDFTRRGMLIDAKVTDSILEGSDSVCGNSLTLWIEEFEQEVRARLAQPLTCYELQDRLTDILEMLFLKGNLLDASTTYRLFCCAAPSFLQMVYSNPTLQPTQDHSALISMAHLLAYPRYSSACFMLMDVMGSMVYGVPQLVAYNTDIEPFHFEPHPVEWVNCFPGEFLVLLAKINIYRDQGAVTGDWQDIEQRLVSWVSQPKFEPKGLEA
ncbi:hypothetical protein FRC11_012440 [Ceratobasidium sp. 423]|nr:hypothetical protein FRC11_012440 [Ceratobasidium sp. 423]